MVVYVCMLDNSNHNLHFAQKVILMHFCCFCPSTGSHLSHTLEVISVLFIGLKFDGKIVMKQSNSKHKCLEIYVTYQHTLDVY